MLWNAALEFFILGEHLNEKRGKLVLLPVAGGCHVHKESLPMRNRCRHLKNFWGSFPSAKACNIPFPDCWSGLLWANNRATQEVRASEVKAWKESLQSYLRGSFPSSLSTVSHLQRLFLFSVPGDGDAVRAAGMQQLRQSGLRQLHPAAEPWEQASPAR